MSFENERRRRIQAIMEILEKAGPQGVVPQVLYKAVAPEITKERFLIYVQELTWAGSIAKLQNGKIRLLK